jgi:hypothetical protein
MTISGMSATTKPASNFGNIIFFFSIAYAIGYAGMGWLTDKIGIRLGLAAAVGLPLILNLSAHRYWLDRRRLGFLGPDQERHGRVPRPQDHAAHLCRLHGTGISCAAA